MALTRPLLTCLAVLAMSGAALADPEAPRRTATPTDAAPGLPPVPYGVEDGLVAPPTGAFANIGRQLYDACDGDALHFDNPGGVLLCMGERLNAACGDNQDCRRAVHQWEAATLRY